MPYQKNIKCHLHCKVASGLWWVVLYCFRSHWVIPGIRREESQSWIFKTGKEDQAWEVAPLTLIWEERNKGTFRRIEMNFVHFKNGILCFFFFLMHQWDPYLYRRIGIFRRVPYFNVCSLLIRILLENMSFSRINNFWSLMTFSIFF